MPTTGRTAGLSVQSGNDTVQMPFPQNDGGWTKVVDSSEPAPGERQASNNRAVQQRMASGAVMQFSGPGIVVFEGTYLSY